MGLMLSRVDSSSYGNSVLTTIFREDSSFHNFFDNPITEDLLIEILSFVPERDLLLNCQLVCKQWRDLIDEQTIWRLKCQRENISLPTRRMDALPKHHYRYVYQYGISEKNLLENPFGQDKLAGWQVLCTGGNDFTTENPPVGCDPVPPEVGSQSCFATSYQRCAKEQVIDLHQKKYNKYLLINDLVSIKVGEWYGARFDCGSCYELKVELLDISMNIIEDFVFSFNWEQWQGGNWAFVDHEFTNVNNVNFVRFKHLGNDMQFWAGHYGSKFTGGFIKLNIV